MQSSRKKISLTIFLLLSIGLVIMAVITWPNLSDTVTKNATVSQTVINDEPLPSLQIPVTKPIDRLVQSNPVPNATQVPQSASNQVTASSIAVIPTQELPSNTTARIASKGQLPQALLTLKSAKIKNLPVLEGSSDAVLNKGVAGHYPNTASAGRVGNFAMAGHRVSHSGPFNYLDRVHKGDKIYVQTATRFYTYKVNVIKIVGPNNPTPLAPIPFHPGKYANQAYITLTTCTPRGTTNQRLIISGVLIAVR